MRKLLNMLTGFGIAIILLFTLYAIAEQNDFSTLGWDRTYGNSIFRVNSDKDFIPGKDDTYSIGDSTHEIKNLYIDGIANIDSLIADTADINGGTIDGATIGSASASTGEFTTLKATTHILYLSEIVNCDTDTDVTAANSGALYTNKGATTAVIFTLPSAAAGLTYLCSSVAADTTLDITITAASGDKINGGSAAGSYAAASSEEKRACTIIAVDDTDWRVISEVGTWSN